MGVLPDTTKKPRTVTKRNDIDMKKIFIATCVAGLYLASAAQTRVGVAQEYTKAHKNPYAQAQTSAGTVRLSVYGDGIVRTQVFEGNEPEQRWCPAVIAVPKTTGFSFTDEKNTATLETPKMRVIVDKASGQIVFFDATGKLLTKTAAGGGVIEHDENGGVSQKFLLSEGEHIYGVGQYVNGLPYVNGTGCTLEQNNMEDAGHVVLSDRRYGMFWNNPSGGQFEAFGNHELLSDKYVAHRRRQTGIRTLVLSRRQSNKTRV